ncbi:MAG: hypothetical protein ABIA74_06060 [bacterium]
MEKFEKAMELEKKRKKGESLTDEEEKIIEECREEARWSFLEIGNGRIKKLTKDVIEKLCWYDEKTKEQSSYSQIFNECLEKIILRKTYEYKKELTEDIKDLNQTIKKWETVNESCENLKERKRPLKKELAKLNNDEKINNLLGYCIQVFYPKKNSGVYPQWKVVLFEDNIKKENLSDKEIKLLVGHELAHVYLHVITKYGNINHYEIDDRMLCDFIAEKLFKVV